MGARPASRARTAGLDRAAAAAKVPGDAESIQQLPTDSFSNEAKQILLSNVGAGYMANIIDALALKLQSKICYHRDANIDYLEIKDMVDKLVEENKELRGEKRQYLDMINAVIEEKENLQHDYEEIKEQVAPMEEQLETVKKELALAKEQLVAAKHENEATKHEHVVANEELMAAKHENVAEKHEHVITKEKLVVANAELAQRNEELEVLRKRLEESEAMHTQIQQQKRSTPGPEPAQSIRVTRSTYKREKMLTEIV